MDNEMTCFDCNYLVITENDVCLCGKKESLVAWNDDACEFFEQIAIDATPDNLVTILSGNIMFRVPDNLLEKPQRPDLMQYIAKYADLVRSLDFPVDRFTIAYDDVHGFYAY